MFPYRNGLILMKRKNNVKKSNKKDDVSIPQRSDFNLNKGIHEYSCKGNRFPYRNGLILMLEQSPTTPAPHTFPYRNGLILINR